MGFLDNLKDWKDKLADEVKKFQNSDFLHAVLSGCALVAAADGSIDSDEKKKMLGFVGRSAELSCFKTKDVKEKFSEIASSIEFDASIGKEECLASIRKMKDKPDAARMLVRVCCAIGAADGDFDEDEKGAVREICNELGLDCSEFGL